MRGPPPNAISALGCFRKDSLDGGPTFSLVLMHSSVRPQIHFLIDALFD